MILFLIKKFSASKTLLYIKNEYQVKFSSKSVLSHKSSLIFSTFTNMQFHLMVSYLEPQEKRSHRINIRTDVNVFYSTSKM